MLYLHTAGRSCKEHVPSYSTKGISFAASKGLLASYTLAVSGADGLYPLYFACKYNMAAVLGAKCLYRGVVVVILVIIRAGSSSRLPTRPLATVPTVRRTNYRHGIPSHAWYLASERHKRGCEVGRQCGSMHPDTIRPGVTKPAGWNQVFHFSRRIGPSSQNEFPRPVSSTRHIPWRGAMQHCRE